MSFKIVSNLAASSAFGQSSSLSKLYPNYVGLAIQILFLHFNLSQAFGQYGGINTDYKMKTEMLEHSQE